MHSVGDYLIKCFPVKQTSSTPFPPSTMLPLFLAAALPIAGAATVELWWNISYVEGANPSGLEPRRVIGVNGTWPPPPVTVTQNDTLIIHAFNGLPDTGTALHTHGIYFNGSSYYDGAVSVTQWHVPISLNFSHEPSDAYPTQPHSSRRDINLQYTY